jgi:hypothetical protein
MSLRNNNISHDLSIQRKSARLISAFPSPCFVLLRTLSHYCLHMFFLSSLSVIVTHFLFLLVSFYSRLMLNLLFLLTPSSLCLFVHLLLLSLFLSPSSYHFIFSSTHPLLYPFSFFPLSFSLFFLLVRSDTETGLPTSHLSPLQDPYQVVAVLIVLKLHSQITVCLRTDGGSHSFLSQVSSTNPDLPLTTV